MKWWKKFWRLRKQHDAIKVMLLFLIVGTGFWANAVYNSVRLYQMSQTPAEYVLLNNTSGSITNSNIKELQKLEDITAFSLQTDTSITLKYQGNEATFSCAQLSQAYIEAAYGVKESGATKTFYMNQNAFGQFIRGTSDAQTPEYQKEQGSPLTASYAANSQPTSAAISRDTASSQGKDSDAVAAQLWRTARIVLIETNTPDEPFVCCSDGSDTTYYATGIRVYMQKQISDTEIAHKLQSLGFTFENTDMELKTEYTQKLLAGKIRHGIATALICLACAATIWKFVYKRTSVTI